MRKLLLFAILSAFFQYSQAQLNISANNGCSGSSFQITITGLPANANPASPCGNAITGGLATSGNIVVAATNFTFVNNQTVTANLALPAGYTGGSYDFKINFDCNVTGTCTSCFTVNTPPTAVAVTPNTTQNICTGAHVNLTCNASGATSYQWKLSDGTVLTGQTSAVYAATTTGTYVCEAINSCGNVTSNAVTVNVNALPTLAPTATPAAICTGGSTLIAANATAGSGTISSYLWSSALPANSPAGTVSPVSTGNYGVTVTNSNSCSATGSISVTVNAVPVVSPAATLTTLCSGTTTTLSAGATAGSGTITTYAWSSGLAGNVDSGDVVPTATTTYTVTVTNSNSCSATGNVAVTANDNPVLAVTAVPPAICTGGTTTVTANVTAGSNQDVFTWNSADLNGHAGSVSPANTTTYVVTVVNSNNCSATDSVTVAVSASPTPPIINSSSNPICKRDTATITAPAGYSAYVWSTGDTTESIHVSEANSYTITVTTGCGTVSSTQLLLHVNDPGTPVVSQTGNSLKVASATAVSYTWYNSATLITGAVDSVYTPAQSGSYSAQITDTNGCTAISNTVNYVALGIDFLSDNIWVNITPNPAKNFVTVSTNYTSNMQISMLDLNGRVIDLLPATSNSIHVDLSKYTRGIYLLKLTAGQTQTIKKLVVE